MRKFLIIFLFISLFSNYTFIYPYHSFLYNPDIPGSIGKIVNTYEGKKGKPYVILIQDYHCNELVQKNIAEILDILTDKYEDSLNFIGIEGSVGEIKTDIIKNIPDNVIKLDIANRLLERGLITGIEFFDIFSTRKNTIIGLENRALYNKNLSQLKRALVHNIKLNYDIQNFREKMQVAKIRGYKDKLKEIDQFYNKYKRNHISLLSLINEINGLTDNRPSIDNYPNLKLYITGESKIENINKSVFKREVKRFIKNLDSYMTQIEKKKLAAYKDRDFYTYLVSLVDKYKIPIKETFPNIFEYKSALFYLFKMDEIDLRREVSLYIYNLEKSNAVGKNEKDLVFLDRYSDLLKMYINNNITFKASQELESNSGQFFRIAADMFGFAEMQSINRGMKIVKEFYDTTQVRSETLVDNMISYNEELYVLVVGGFHSDSVMKYLRDKGYGYTTIAPSGVSTAYDKKFYCKRIQELEIDWNIGNRFIAVRSLFENEMKVLDILMYEITMRLMPLYSNKVITKTSVDRVFVYIKNLADIYSMRNKFFETNAFILFKMYYFYLGEIIDLKYLKDSYDSHASVMIETDNGPYIMKNIADTKSRGLYIMSLVKHLYRKRIPIPFFTRKYKEKNKPQNFIADTSYGNFILKEHFKKGEFVLEPKSIHYFNIAKLAARVQNVLAGFDAPGDAGDVMGVDLDQRLVDNILDKIYSLMSLSDEFCLHLESLILEQYELFLADYPDIKSHLVESNICGNLHIDNIKFGKKDKVEGFIDLDQMHRNYRIVELVNIVLGGDIPNYSYEKLKTVVVGYETEINLPLNQYEIQGIISLLRTGFIKRFSILNDPESIKYAAKNFEEFSNDLPDESSVMSFIQDMVCAKNLIQIRKEMRLGLLGMMSIRIVMERMVQAYIKIRDSNEHKILGFKAFLKSA